MRVRQRGTNKRLPASASPWGRVALLGIAQRSVSTRYSSKTRKQQWARPLPPRVNSISDWVQIHLQRTGLSPYHLAKAIGVPTNMVRSWVDGTDRPNKWQLEILAKLFGSDTNLSATRTESVFSGD